MLRWADKCAEEAYRYLKLDALNACMIADRETALNGFRKRTRENSFAAFAVPEPIGLKSDIRHSAGAGKTALDYVTRRFNASSAELKKLVGPILRWDTA
jgi:hypothetical protein